MVSFKKKKFLVCSLRKFLFQFRSLPIHISQHAPRIFLVLERERERERERNTDRQKNTLRERERERDVMGHISISVVRHGVLVPWPLVDPKVVGPVLLIPHFEKVGPT